MKTVFLFFGVLALVSGQTTQVSQCTVTQNTPMPLNTYIEGCFTPPCDVPQEQYVILNVVFESPRNIRSLRTLAQAFIIGNLGTHYDLGEEANTCRFLTNTFCPILEKEIVTYTLRMYIDPNFPRIPVTIEFRIEDEETNQPITCFRAGIRVVAPLTRNGSNATITNLN